MTTGSASPPGGALVDVATLQGGNGASLQESWRELASTARHANPFQSPDLLVPAVRHLAGRDQVRLLVVPEPGPGASLGLVMPLVSRQRFRRVPVRVTKSWQHTHHFLGTPLVSPRFGVDGWVSALAHLAEHAPDPWLVLTGIDADIAADVEAAARRTGREARRLRSWSRATTYRRATDDYVEQRLSGSRRKELRRVRRRLSESLGGGLAVVDLVASGGLERGIEAYLDLEAAGWKGARGAMRDDPHERAYFADMCRALAPRGGVEILALQGHDARPVALAVNLRDAGTLFTFKIAYDERYASYSPGLLLWLDQLSRFHDSGDAMLDTCSEPGHPMAGRLHADQRSLVDVAVALGPRGQWVVRGAPSFLRAGERARPVIRSRIRYRPSADRVTPGVAPDGDQSLRPTKFGHPKPSHTKPRGKQR